MPRIRPPVLAGGPCSGAQRADASHSVLAAATAPAPRAPSAMDASSSAPNVLQGAATPCRESASARRATGEPGNAGSGAGLGVHSPRGHFPSFPLSSSCNDTCPEGYFGVNCSSPCQCSRGTCHPVRGDCVLSKCKHKFTPWQRSRERNILAGDGGAGRLQRRLLALPRAASSCTLCAEWLYSSAATGHTDSTHPLHIGLKDHGALAAAILVPLLLLLLCVACCCCGAGPADARDRYLLYFSSFDAKLSLLHPFTPISPAQGGRAGRRRGGQDEAPRAGGAGKPQCYDALLFPGRLQTSQSHR